MRVPTLSVIVPVCDGGAAFERCLGALAAASPPADEIVVVDDGSRDGSGSRAAPLANLGCESLGTFHVSGKPIEVLRSAMAKTEREGRAASEVEAASARDEGLVTGQPNLGHRS